MLWFFQWSCMESWTINKAQRRRIDAFELWCWGRLLRVPWTEDQSWVFIGRTDVEGETLILWPPDVKSWLIWKDPDAGKDWGQEPKGTTEDEMVGWHHRLNGHGFEWTQGVGDGQGGLACCDSWGCKESDTTEWLNWTELILSCSIVSDFLKPHGLYPTRILCPWDISVKNTEVGCYLLFQGIFLTQGSNPHLLCLLHWQADSLSLSQLGISQ